MKLKTIPNWSPSKITCYEQCPRQAKYKYVEKLPEPKSPALERGSLIHEMAESYIAGRVDILHKDLEKVKDVLNPLRAAYKKRMVRVEMEVAVDKDWKLVHWLAPEVYARFKLDVLELKPGKKLVVTDWKTGRFNPKGEYDDQLSSYAVAALVTGLGEEVISRLVFTDTGDVVERPAGFLKLSELDAAKRNWEERARKLLADKRFPTKPGNHCRWCAYSANKGGPCEF